MKEAEAFAMRSGITALRLMENAGSASARFIRTTAAAELTRCTVVCGPGNNGGDGFVVARRLLDAGASVTVVLACGAPRTQDASDMFERLPDLNIGVLDYERDRRRCLSLISQSSLIIDAVFGTGFHGQPEGDLPELFKRMNESSARIFSLDMPSGANADTGTVEGECVNAAHTVSFAAAKIGQFAYPAADHCGKVTVVNIGIPEEAFSGFQPVEVLDFDMVKHMLPVRGRNSNKGDYGRVLSLCGSVSMPGAAYMAATAAARCGAGLITAGAPRSVWPVLAGRFSEVMTTPLEETDEGTLAYSNLEKILEMAQNASCVLIGCGVTRNTQTVQLINELIVCLSCPVVLDADGINAVSGHMNVLRASKADLILTPHPGEMARLTGMSIPEVQADRMKIASDFAKDSGATLVLKGAGTVVACPDGRVFVNPTGNPGLSRGGSGDILAGMIAGLRAQGLDSAAAAAGGVFIHGLAGDRCAEKYSQYGMLPTDLFTEVPLIFRDMSR